MSNLPIAKLNSRDVVVNRINEFFSHIANGGAATQYCKLVQCDYSELMRLIRMDEELYKQYKLAVEDRKEWARERIFEELKYMGSYNIQDAVNSDGTLKRAHELPEDLARSIKEIDADGGIKFADKRSALVDKAKLLGLSSEKVEVTGSLTLADIILQAKAIKAGDK